MNGRVYDPVLARFLSPDPYVQAPDFTQSFNRYAYCWNNPFKYTDPSGNELVATLIVVGGALLGSYLGGVASNSGELNPIQWDWKDPMTYLMMGVGGIVGAVAGYGIINPGSITFAFGAEISTPWISAGIGVTGITATGFSSDWGLNGPLQLEVEHNFPLRKRKKNRKRL